MQGDAVVDYTVDNETMVESMHVESRSNYESRAGVSRGILDGLFRDAAEQVEG